MKIGVPVKLQLTSRYYLYNRQFAIRDAFDALVELITNADDSYHRLWKRQGRAHDGGPILVETCANKTSPFMVVRDRAEGMTLQVMEKKLLKVGERSSEEGDRGFMARGARDVTELGNVIFESIVDERYYKSTITADADFIPLDAGRSVTAEIRKALHIDKGNGTVVTVEFTRHSMPRASSIHDNLPLHFAIRDIVAENSPSEVLFKDLNSKDKPQKLTFYQPQGKLVCKEDFIVQGYPDAKAKLVIYKAAEPLIDYSEKFRKSGLLIKGNRGIYECSLLQPSFEKDPFGKKYFGRIDCEYLDYLLEDYDKKRESHEAPSIDNPQLVIDPNRQYGLMRTHPFVKALLDIPTKRLKELIDIDRATSEKTREEIESDDLRKKLSKLAKAAAKYLGQQVEDIDETGIDSAIDEAGFTKTGIMIFPTYANIAKGDIRSFGLYVDRKIYDKERAEVSLKSDSSAVEFLTSFVKLEAHKTRKSLLYGRFSIKGLEIKDGICIETKCEGMPKAEALINVVENKIEEHEFTCPLEFEQKHYKVKEGSSKTIRLYAQYPELVNSETDIKVISSDNLSLPIKGKCILVPVQGSNFARAEITVEARRLTEGIIALSAKLNDLEATTKVKIIQEEENGIPIEIKIRDEDFGNFRARWGDNEGKPYLLLISAKHPSLKRYLGAAPTFPGQKAVHFRAIIAEIVAESVCRKSLRLESEHHSWLFQWSNLREDKLIADSVMSELQKRMKEFLPIAHELMIEEKEIGT